MFITHDFLEALKIGNHICIMKDGEFVQVGTPAQIVTQPADDYVREFVKDVPRARVLTAAAIMRPATAADPADAPAVRADTRLDALIPLTAAGLGRLRVVDENEETIGWVDRPGLMSALAG